jgi:hypothetical protein
MRRCQALFLIFLLSGTLFAQTTKEEWAERLESFVTRYTEQPPFELVHTLRPLQDGVTDYVNNTVNLEFTVSLRPSTERLAAMQAELRSILTDLDATGQRGRWGFAAWPYDTGLFGPWQKFTVNASLVNNSGRAIKLVTFTMQARLAILRSTIFADMWQNEIIGFTAIPATNENLSGGLRIAVTAINNEPDLMPIVAADVMPRAVPVNFFALLTRPSNKEKKEK